ncbi:TIGR01459 family HAD-type hydrolase [Maritimibacter sp. HL-12]|uniref:TIGR01459 family HAD-type hydrolase n=1 Tax=Maritimibacter sp. HL-12 TaxID=1162418 RepID=UPI000A0F3F0B|nr:TIGR01459 family HAD-type hydrolase [Maritimibacter sp. HL-12]SMH36129.1 HAD-superfamily class IIA hydrolase, TIGR01459 [Maritimibacter sp. HL-12]
MTRIIERLDEIAAPYDVLLCDLWGCVHDGVRPLPDAVAALQGFRATGGTVILVTNAPRQRSAVQAHLEEMGLPGDAWDDIASSGDAARAAMYRGAAGNKVWFMGEPHDEVFFEPMALVENPVEIARVPLEEAEGIVCTGPFDPLADPADLRPHLLYAKQKGLKLLCANPDIVVDRGDVREWCAGAVAALYTEMGGESLFFGKPHPAIYDLARARLAALGKSPDNARTLAIGDGIHTDIQGAQGEDIDSLFITGGLAARETNTVRQPDAAALAAYVERAMVTPTFAMGFLR